MYFVTKEQYSVLLPTLSSGQIRNTSARINDLSAIFTLCLFWPAGRMFDTSVLERSAQQLLVDVLQDDCLLTRDFEDVAAALLYIVTYCTLTVIAHSVNEKSMCKNPVSTEQCLNRRELQYSVVRVQLCQYESVIRLLVELGRLKLLVKPAFPLSLYATPLRNLTFTACLETLQELLWATV